MFKIRSLHILLFCFLVTICSAILQYFNPSVGFFDGGLIAAILLTILLKEDIYTKLLGVIGIVLIIIASLYQRGNLEAKQVVMQHLFSVIIIIMTIIFVLYIKRLYRNIESDQRQKDSLFKYATEGVILTDDSGKIVLLNPAALSLFGYERDELIGKSIELLLPERFRHAHERYREGFYQNPGNRVMGRGRDLYARKKDNKEFPVEISLSYYKLKNKPFVIAFIVDIATRKQIERELLDRQAQLEKITEDMGKLNASLEVKVEQRTTILREALKELENSQGELNDALSKERELGEIKSRFVSMASHEFRTPLSTVLSSASLLAKYTLTEDQDKRDKHIKRIKDSVRHLNDLLDDFLSLGRLEEGVIKAEISRFPMKELFDEVVDEINPILKEGQAIVLNTSGPEEYNSDKRLLRNILINLLSNASKFSPENSSIRLDVQHSKGQGMKISVRDEGIGISQEDQQHLFTSFYRGKNVLNIEGTGLGLHIVKRYVDLLGGSISLESRLDYGTTITLDLPE